MSDCLCASIIERMSDAIVTVDGRRVVVLFNVQAERIFGYAADAVLGQPLDMLLPEIAIWRRMGEALDLVGRRKDGETFPVEVTMSEIEHNESKFLTALVRDVSARKRVEKEQLVRQRTDEVLQSQEQLVRAQKMEAIGSLAGGVAHDFNNLLTVIRGRAERLLARSDRLDPGRQDIDAIVRAADRAAMLTEQLLAVGQKQARQPGPTDLGEVTASLRDVLRTLVGPDTQIVLESDPGLQCVWADRGQMEQVLVNLVTNAREAMPAGGRIMVETANAIVSGHLADRLGAPPGPYVTLAVLDQGLGLAEEVQAHIFEPFYAGTFNHKRGGLSLAAVHGIVKQSGGYVDVDSGLKMGTCFVIYLPALGGALPTEAPSVNVAASVDVAQTGKTILLAEDEEDVRDLVADFLETAGYHVLVAADGAAALRAARDRPGPIDLLITDVVMPSMDGPTLVTHMAGERPGLKVVFITGYAPQSNFLRGEIAPNATLLRKPFSLETLARVVHEQLGRW